MAIKSLHAKITRKVLKEFGFSDTAQEKAGKANVAVDDNQGNRPEDAHLHAMLGMVTNNRGTLVPEDREKGIAAITALIDNKRKEILANIRKVEMLVPGKTKRAEAETVLESIGGILHTIQDREFHGYGIWRHDGMCSAVVKDLLGLILHGVHDTGLGYATLAGGSNAEGRWRVQATLGVALSQRHDVHLYGGYSRTAGLDLTTRHTVAGGFCFGACGSTRPTRGSNFPPGPLGKPVPGDAGGPSIDDGIVIKGQASSRPVNKVWDRTERATRNFVEGLQRQANQAKVGSWQEFVAATR